MHHHDAEAGVFFPFSKKNLYLSLVVDNSNKLDFNLVLVQLSHYAQSYEKRRKKENIE
jgi:hypothetical protein